MVRVLSSMLRMAVAAAQMKSYAIKGWRLKDLGLGKVELSLEHHPSVDLSWELMNLHLHVWPWARVMGVREVVWTPVSLGEAR
jgi:hypothetical protein